MSTVTGTRSGCGSLGTGEWVGVALAVLLGITYLFEAVDTLPGVVGVAFLLAGLGYFGAVALVLADYCRPLVYAGGSATTSC